MTIPPDNALGLLLQDVGRAIWGDIWIGKLAYHMGMNRRTVQRLCAGSLEPDDENHRQRIVSDLQTLVRKIEYESMHAHEHNLAALLIERNRLTAAIGDVKHKLNAARGAAANV